MQEILLGRAHPSMLVGNLNALGWDWEYQREANGLSLLSAYLFLGALTVSLALTFQTFLLLLNH